MVYPQSVTYALEALCHLARTDSGTYLKAREISEEKDIPEHFLGKVLTQLVRRGLLVSQKGPTGGVSLARSAGKITIQDVLDALDANETLDDRCVLGMSTCSDRESCPFHDQWGTFKKGVTAAAKKTTLARLANS
jgi:Rrf2 family protein